MRTELKLLLAVHPETGKKVLMDSEGQSVNLESCLAKYFSLKKGESVLVCIQADDLMHEPAPFDIETARAILAQKRRGYFATVGNEKVRLYNASLNGDWPVMGVNPTGHPCLWNELGEPQNGDAALRLVLQLEIPPEENPSNDAKTPAEGSGTE